MWSFLNGSLLYSFRGHTGNINSLDISKDNRYLISSSEDGTCRIWDIT